MQKNVIRKSLVIGLIILFIGVSVVPSISGNIEEINIRSKSYIKETKDNINIENSRGRGTLMVDPPEEVWNKTFGGIEYDGGSSVQQTSDDGYIITGNTYSYGAGSWDAWLIKTDSNGVEVWNKTFGGINNDGASYVQQTSDDGYVILGYTTSYDAGSGDFWLIKTDSDGVEVWNKTMGGAKADYGSSVQQTSDDGFILTGYTKSYATGESDVWLIKTNSNGVEIWNKTFGGIDNEGGSSVQQTSDDGYVILGYTTSYSAGSADVWLIKTDSNGVEVWNKTFGGIEYDGGKSVEQISDDGYILTGYTYSYGNVGGSGPDVWLIKTDSNGVEVWNKTFGGMEYDYGLSVQQISDDGFILTGYTYSYGAGIGDAWLIKTDSNGVELWNKTFGGIEHDVGFSVRQTSDDGYIITGGTSSYGAGSADVWLIKVASENHPPEAPIITGDNNGYVGVEYDFEVVGIDPDGNDVWYYIEWGDGDKIEWDGPYDSGEVVTYDHTWTEEGTYIIKAKAKDNFDEESDWGTLTVEISSEPEEPELKIRLKMISIGKVSATIENKGSGSLSDINWNITAKGGIFRLFKRIDVNASGTIENLAKGEKIVVSTHDKSIILRFCIARVTVTATVGEKLFTHDQFVVVIGRFVFARPLLLRP